MSDDKIIKSKTINKKNKKRTSRKTLMIMNICFTVFLAIFIVFGLMHTFSGKNKYRNRGIECYNAKNYSEAIEYFEKSLDCNQWFSKKVDADVELYLADSYIKTEDFNSAKLVYNRLLNDYPEKYYDKADVLYMIEIIDNLIIFSKGDYTAPLDGLKAAVDNGYPELALYVAICYEKKNDIDNMKKYYDVYSSVCEMDSYLALKYTQYYILSKDYSTALSYAKQGIALSDSKYIKELEYLEIVCYTKLTQFDTAYQLSNEYILKYPEELIGKELNEYLDTRINIDTVPISDKFSQTTQDEE